MTERIGTGRAADILGVSRRKVQAMASSGDIPGAQIGRVWTFDEAALRLWLQNREAEQCQKGQRCLGASSGAARPFGAGSRSTAPIISEAYERLFSPKQSRAERHG
ncbi:MAG: helix-turn-helix domain-containing protein [Hyphomicrobiaceae bacterium]